MSRFSSAIGVVLLLAGCVGNVVDAEQRLGNGFPSDAGVFPVYDTGIEAGGIVPGFGGGTTGAGAWSGGTLPGAGASLGGSVIDAGAPVVDSAGPMATSDLENACGNGAEPLATDMQINELSIYQVVKIPLFKDGAWVSTRNASVVQGKKALLRTFITPMASYRPRPLRAVLTLDNDGQRTQQTSEKSLSTASTDDATGSTFDFALDPELIGANTQLSVAILETTCNGQAAAGTGARVPSTGLTDLGAVHVGKLRVVLVPVSLGGRVPDTSDAQLAKIHDEMLAYYPVPSVDITARAAITWDNTIAASGTGWSELLNQIGRTRQQDAPARDIYYFGLIAPAASFSEYCRTGCVLGLAPQTTFVSPPDQIGLGVGFVNSNTYSTVVHEVGHAHGRAHAPCAPAGGQIQSPDPRYPYAGGKIGTWGWDSRSGQLLTPTRYTDVMGYCDPTWISDFNYEAIATRSRTVNTQADILITDKTVATQWQRVILFADGSARWAGVSTTETPLDLVSARILDAQGNVLGETSVSRVPLSHSDDSFLYVPQPEQDWAALDLGDRTLVLSEIAPAR